MSVDLFLASKAIRAARQEVGYRESRNPAGVWTNGEKFAAAVPGLSWADFQPWCAVFVSWCMLQGGDIHGKRAPFTASCEEAMTWYEDRGWWSQSPSIGAQVIYGTDGDAQHTGIVTAFSTTHIMTVEGNTNDSGSAEGNGVYAKARPRATWILGYGRPLYDVEHAAPRPVPAPATGGSALGHPKLSLTVEQVAEQIVKGTGGWGDGEPRIRALIAAGYNPGVVQAQVDRIMRGLA